MVASSQFAGIVGRNVHLKRGSDQRQDGMSIGSSLYDEEGAKIVPEILAKAWIAAELIWASAAIYHKLSSCGLTGREAWRQDHPACGFHVLLQVRRGW